MILDITEINKQTPKAKNKEFFNLYNQLRGKAVKEIERELSIEKVRERELKKVPKSYTIEDLSNEFKEVTIRSQENLFKVVKDRQEKTFNVKCKFM